MTFQLAMDVNVPSEVFYHSRNEMLPVQNRTMMVIVIEPKPGTYALILSCASKARIQVGRQGIMQLQLWRLRNPNPSP